MTPEFWTGLKAFVLEASGVAIVAREDETQPHVPSDPTNGPGCIALLAFTNRRDVGQTPSRQYLETVEGDDGQVFENTERMRNVVLRVRFKSYDARPGRESEDYGLRFRDALESDEARLPLDALGLAFGQILFDGAVPLGEDDQENSIYIVDVRFLWRSSRVRALGFERIDPEASEDVTNGTYDYTHGTGD